MTDRLTDNRYRPDITLLARSSVGDDSIKCQKYGVLQEVWVNKQMDVMLMRNNVNCKLTPLIETSAWEQRPSRTQQLVRPDLAEVGPWLSTRRSKETTKAIGLSNRRGGANQHNLPVNKVGETTPAHRGAKIK
ncbi:hypothetical protein Btru_071574 [Bulinus truncatus]|nr:hypothetical protein Btru_071574 [Bulinus truncatus]